MRKRIAEKERKVNPRRYNLRQVEDELETYQSFLADIIDEMNKIKS